MGNGEHKVFDEIGDWNNNAKGLLVKMEENLCTIINKATELQNASSKDFFVAGFSKIYFGKLCFNV